MSDDLRPEYDLSKLKGGVRGKYLNRPPLDFVTYCPHCHTPVVSVEIRKLYDGVAYYYCEHCKLYWSRKGNPLTEEQAVNMKREEVFEL